jgi:hypothetical protein
MQRRSRSKNSVYTFHTCVQSQKEKNLRVMICILLTGNLFTDSVSVFSDVNMKRVSGSRCCICLQDSLYLVPNCSMTLIVPSTQRVVFNESFHCEQNFPCKYCSRNTQAKNGGYTEYKVVDNMFKRVFANEINHNNYNPQSSLYVSVHMHELRTIEYWTHI